MKFSPMIRQRIGNPDTDVHNWGLRDGTYSGDFRASELNHDEDFQVDCIQTATLGSSIIPSPINFEKKFNSSIVDPKQDLAVLVEDEQEGSKFARFHFHSLTTGQPHPLAEHPILTVSFDDGFLHQNNLSDEPMTAHPEIMGKYFVVKIYWPESDFEVSEILLWDWRTAILLARIYIEHSSARSTFLDKSHLLVYSTLPENGHQSTRIALLIYRIPNAAASQEVPPNADFRTSLYPKHNPILVFEFPELHPSWTITGQQFMLYSAPLPGDVVYSKSATFLCSRINTLGIDFRIWNNPTRQFYVYGSHKGTPTDFHVFVKTHYLFEHLLAHQPEGLTTHIIPWSEWGANATRWFIEDGSIEHISAEVHESRYIRSTITKTETQLLSIVDFNTPTIKRHAYISTAKSRTKRVSADIAEKTAVLEGRGLIEGRLFQTRISSSKLPIPTIGQVLNPEVVTETIGSDMKTVILKGFKNPVISCLPYRVVTKVQRMPLHGHWRIHGEYLVGVVSLAY
ncbi:hypothetical protein OPQ81_008393 [Rhizoctonia solani]|nr:hypothetical protein OPQ81_008393 [Rhizoctonia solani]